MRSAVSVRPSPLYLSNQLTLSLIFFMYIGHDHSSLGIESYASAVYATALCLCVFLCLSQVDVLLKRINGPRWFLARRLYPSTYTLFCKEIRVGKNNKYNKITVVPFGTLSQTLD